MNHLNITSAISGEYKLSIKRADGTVEETDWFDNIILDSGLDRLAINTSGWVLQFARVGTGNSTPVATQTSLDAQIAFSSQVSGSPTVVNEGAPLYRTTQTFSYAFAQGAVVGNISELGIGWATTGTSLFSRALILDNTGTPTTITLVSLDQLTVFYRIRIIPPTTDASGSITIGSTPYSYTARVANVGSFATGNSIFIGPNSGATGSLTTPNAAGTLTYGSGSSLGAITGAPTLQSGATGTVTFGTYTNGNFFRDDVFTWGISAGNATGGIQCIMIAYGGSPSSTVYFQYRFATVIPKTNTNTLTLTVRISWTRA